MGTKAVWNAAHIYPTTIEYESRIRHMTGALAKRADVGRIVVYGFPAEGLAARESMNEKTEVHRVGKVAKGGGLIGKLISFLGWYLAVVLAALRFKPNVVNCHSLSVLPVSWLLAKLNRACLIYEPHELETETLTMGGRRKAVAKRLEGRLIGAADLVIAVSESIAQRYRQDYGPREVEVIRNSPPLSEHSMIENSDVVSYRQLFGIPEDDIVFLYQGALEEGRGVRIILDAFALGVEGRHVVFMGFGSLEDEIRERAEALANVHFHLPVPTVEVLQYTLGADVGIAFLDRSCLNHEYALPNKFFQYLHAGKPVMCTNLIEMGEIVKRYQVGWLVEPDADSIRDTVNRIERDQWVRFRSNVSEAVKVLNWQNEERNLNRIYDAFLQSTRFAGD